MVRGHCLQCKQPHCEFNKRPKVAVWSKGYQPMTVEIGCYRFLYVQCLWLQTASTMLLWANLLYLTLLLLFMPGAAPTNSDEGSTVSDEGSTVSDEGSTATITTIYVNPNSSSAIGNSTCWDGGITNPCKSLDLGLEGLWRQSHANNITGTSLSIAPGKYTLSASTPARFSCVSQLSIIAINTGNETKVATIKCAQGAGLSFINVHSLEIRYIQFLGCGALQNSTSSSNNEMHPAFLQFYVGLYFLYCKDITLFNVTVAFTPGTGVVFYNTVGNNTIEYSYFHNNSFNGSLSPQLSGGGGGIYVEFSYCEPGLKECLTGSSEYVNPNYTHDAKYLFTHTGFKENNAALVDHDNGTFILPHKQYHLAFGRGGGLSVFFKGNASHNSIIVKDCLFINNQALWGAGVFVEYQDWTNNNNISFIHSWFEGNALPYTSTADSKFAGTGGGGTRIGYITFSDLQTYGNNILFSKCTFSNNVAYYGGGLSFYAAKQASLSLPLDTLSVEGCLFYRNEGRLGAGMDLSLWHASKPGRPLIPSISNCSFVLNNNSYNPARPSLVGLGAVYIDSLPVKFSGDNHFKKNIGSALVLLGSDTRLLAGARICFEENKGRNGGAIAFMGLSIMTMEDNTQIHFLSNSAQYQGGAIFSYNSGEHDLLASRNCFIQFWNVSTQPNNWNAFFYFENNTANGKPNSIHASTLIPCLWGGPRGRTDVDISECFCWQTWNYSGSECTQEISSAPAEYHINSSFSTIPGNPLPLNAVAYDNLNHTVSDTTIYIARIVDGTASFRGNNSLKYNYLSNSLLDIQGKPNTTVQLQIETIDPIVIQTSITVHLKSCPPGFTTEQSAAESSTVCDCPNVTESYYGGYLRCHKSEFQSRLLREAWMGTWNGTKDLVVGLSPYIDKLMPDEEYIELPTDPIELDTFFCNGSHRKGVLCGSCQDGYGPSVTSLECVDCPESFVYYHWIIYLLAVFVPITIFFSLILIFSLPITLGPLNAFIFFAQMITTTVNVDADGMIVFTSLAPNSNSTKWVMKTFQDLYTVLYDVWNLNFFIPWLPSFCLSPHINTLTLMSLSYLPALYPLILIAILSVTLNLYNRGVRLCVITMRPFHRCLARVRGRLNLRQPIAGGIATFLLISYTKFNLTSLQLLSPAPLLDASGDSVVNVIYNNGDIVFGSAESAPYLILASIFLLLFGLIPPILLILPSILHAIDKLHHSPLLEKLQPRGKLQEFLELFHGCYKDGTNGTIDCRWFAGLYFCLRIVIIAIYSASYTWLYQYCLQLLFFLMAAFLFAAFRPYKKDWINVIDTGMFLILAAVTALSSFNLSLARAGNSLSPFAYAVECILIFAPLVYCMLCVIGFFCSGPIQKFAAHRRASIRMRRRQPVNCVLNDNEKVRRRTPLVTTTEVSISSRKSGLEDSTGVENFLDFTQTSGRMGRISSVPASEIEEEDEEEEREEEERWSRRPGTLEQAPLLGGSARRDQEDNKRRHMSGVCTYGSTTSSTDSEQ